MKAEEVRKLADTALEQLENTLKQGKSDSLAAYLAMMGRFHNYSFGNVLLIMTQNPDATRVAGFRTWHKLGRHVKKGEKGIVITAPMRIRPKDAAGGDTTSNEDRTILRFKAAYVFDVSQTDGEPLPEFARVGGNPNGHTERLKAFVSSKGITLDYADDLGSADGASLGGTIKLRRDLPSAEEFSVLTHELAHEMLHPKNGENRLPKTVRETEAEAVAFVVSNAIGLDVGSAAADYIQLYNGGTETLSASLDRIQKAATTIIEAVTSTDDEPTDDFDTCPNCRTDAPRGTTRCGRCGTCITG